MKAVLLALCAGIALFGVVTLELRYVRTARRARMLTMTFAAAIPFLVAGYVATPDDLWFLPAFFVTPIRVIDFGFCVFLFSAGFFGGILQLYNLADRGFSLRILIDILQSPLAQSTPDQVTNQYAGGQGLAWMYDKRIDGLTKSRLIAVDGDRVSLTQRGLRAARIFLWLKKIYGLAC